MRLRSKLILAFFLMAVVPLTGLTFYSYSTSRQALRQAVQQEADRLADQMGLRMDSLAGELEGRVARLGGEWPASPNFAPQTPEWRRELGRWYASFVDELGENQALVQGLEFEPALELKEEQSELAAEADSGEPPPPPPPPPAKPQHPGSLVIQVPESPVTASGGKDFSHHFTFVQSGDKWLLKQDLAKAQAEIEKARQQVEEAIRRRPEKRASAAEAAQSPKPPTPGKPPGAVSPHPDLSLNRAFAYEIRRDGRLIGRLRAQVDAHAFLSRVLQFNRGLTKEIPFAVDNRGNLYTPDEEDQRRLAALNLPRLLEDGESAVSPLDDWVLVTRKAEGGMTFGIARPIGEGLREIERASVRNFGLGLAMIVLAMLGILPLSRRMTHNLGTLAQGAEELARGNLKTRVPVRSGDEIGKLSATFNRMAQELEARQSELVERERLRKELEMCRQIQEELLPRDALRLPFAEVRGVSIPAREVGGDFFNYFVLPAGEVAILIGDVSGKGVPAALLMANLQATLRARLAIQPDLSRLTAELDEEVARQTPPEAFLTLFVAKLNAEGSRLTWVSAGHNPQFLVRQDGRLERLEASGRPLGLLPGGAYGVENVDVCPGDLLFLYTDGLVEAEDPGGEQFGLQRLEAVLKAHQEMADDLMPSMEEEVRRHRRGREAGDDATMMVLQIG